MKTQSFTKLAAILPLLLTSFSSFAYDQANCDSNSLEKLSGNSEINDLFATSRDQDGAGWCYAYSAADLISFKLGKPVSALHLSNLYNDSLNVFERIGRDFTGGNQNGIYQGGYAKDAIEAAQGKSLCTERALSSRINYKDLKGLANIAALVDDLNQQNSANRKDDEFFEELKPVQCSNISKDARNLLSALNCREIATFINKKFELGREAVIEKLIAENCHGSTNSVPVGKFKVRQIGSWHSSDEDEIVTELNAQLDKKNIVSFTYHTDKLNRAGEGGRHESVIIGRRWKNGRCMYVVRNSWGDSGCGATIRDKKYVDCYDAKPFGSYLMSEEGFRRAAYAVTYIE